MHNKLRHQGGSRRHSYQHKAERHACPTAGARALGAELLHLPPNNLLSRLQKLTVVRS